MSNRGTKYLAAITAAAFAFGMSTSQLQGAELETDNTVIQVVEAHQQPLEAKKVKVQKVKKVHPEYRAAKSKDAKDMKGFEPSLYRGKWYTPKAKAERKCIMDRESRFSYRAANRTSSARGAYQFLDKSWREGLVHMFIKESKKTNDGLIKEAKKLRSKPIHKWNRYWQDRAFYTAWRFGEGRKHWYHGYLRCF